MKGVGRVGEEGEEEKGKEGDKLKSLSIQVLREMFKGGREAS